MTIILSKERKKNGADQYLFIYALNDVVHNAKLIMICIVELCL